MRKKKSSPAQRARARGIARPSVSPCAALAFGAGLAFMPAWVQAATFNVTNLNDDGAGSLRQAIADASGAPGADLITFAAGLTGTITLSTGALYIDDSVEVRGPGATVLTVNGNSSSGVFEVVSYDTPITAILSGLTITGGNAAGVLSYGQVDLTLDQVVITGNVNSCGCGGGGVEVEYGSLSLRDSTISGNSAGVGGGVYVGYSSGPVVIERTVISGNDALLMGGGVAIVEPGADVSITDSTISGNSTQILTGGGVALVDMYAGSHSIRRTTISGNSSAAGGGIGIYNTYSPILIENSTVSGNTALSVSGGIDVYLGEGSGKTKAVIGGGVTVRHSTITQNSAAYEAGGIGSYAYSSVTLSHVIVANNSAPTGPDLGGPDTFELDFSLIEQPGTASINDNGGNIFNQSAQLGPLQDNGGPTHTHSPAATSPAVNAGDPAFAPPPSTDQRGFARVAGGLIDIGAVEADLGVVSLNATPNPVVEGNLVTVTVTRSGDGAASVNYATVDGSATAPADFTAASGTLNWGNGDVSVRTFTIATAAHPGVDPTRSFVIELSNATGVFLGTANVTLTIIDDGLPPGGDCPQNRGYHPCVGGPEAQLPIHNGIGQPPSPIYSLYLTTTAQEMERRVCAAYQRNENYLAYAGTNCDAVLGKSADAAAKNRAKESKK